MQTTHDPKDRNETFKRQFGHTNWSGGTIYTFGPLNVCDVGFCPGAQSIRGTPAKKRGSAGTRVSPGWAVMFRLDPPPTVSRAAPQQRLRPALARPADSAVLPADTAEHSLRHPSKPHRDGQIIRQKSVLRLREWTVAQPAPPFPARFLVMPRPLAARRHHHHLSPAALQSSLPHPPRVCPARRQHTGSNTSPHLPTARVGGDGEKKGS